MSDPGVAHAQLRQTPLYILIDRNTASAAEMFAYGAQRLGRATIVGETSSGAANGGTRLSVGMGFALFVPEWKVTNGAGWEGTGVKPDVETKAAEALTAARRLALERLIKDGAQTAEEKADRERALSRL
jgi:C-terminal processing protease CtpA/Prc